MSNHGTTGTRSSSITKLNHLFSNDKSRSGLRTGEKKKTSEGKLNTSLEQHSSLGGNRIASGKSALNTSLKGTGLNGTSSSSHGKGGNQLSQLKSMLVGFKGQIQEKKKHTMTHDSSTKSHLKTRVASGLKGSHSTTKMNSSMDHGRIGQKSLEQHSRLLKDRSGDHSIPRGNGLNTSLTGSGKHSKGVGKSGVSSLKDVSGHSSKLVTSKSSSKVSSLNLGSKPRTPKLAQFSQKKTEDSRNDPSETADTSKKTTTSGSINMKLGHLSMGKDKKYQNVEKSKTDDDRHGGDDEKMIKQDSLEVEESPDLEADNKDAKDFKKKQVSKQGHTLSGLVTQVKPGQMFNKESSKQVNLDKEIEKIHTPRGANKSPEKISRHVHEFGDEWKTYYVKSLIECLKIPDDNINKVKLYKEHFYQTVQSILFLQNVEKIDDNLLVEKKVYLPPNIMSRL